MHQIPRIERNSERGRDRARAVLRMLRDGVTPTEARRIARLMFAELEDDLELDDIACDYREMDQIWRGGRESAPNPHLKARRSDIRRRLIELRGQRTAAVVAIRISLGPPGIAESETRHTDKVRRVEVPSGAKV